MRSIKGETVVDEDFHGWVERGREKEGPLGQVGFMLGRVQPTLGKRGSSANHVIPIAIEHHGSRCVDRTMIEGHITYRRRPGSHRRRGDGDATLTSPARRKEFPGAMTNPTTRFRPRRYRYSTRTEFLPEPSYDFFVTREVPCLMTFQSEPLSSRPPPTPTVPEARESSNGIPLDRSRNPGGWSTTMIPRHESY